MRIALGIWGLTGFGGTESYLLTVATELERHGHDVWIYAPEGGPSADFALDHGMRVIPHESQLPECDAVLAQDTLAAYALAKRFPAAVRVMVAHSFSFALQSPPQMRDACHAVVVMNDRMRQRTEALAWHPRVVRLRQPIDLERFCFRVLNPEQRRPPRVLLLSNYSQGTRHRMIQAACEKLGYAFEHVGATGIPTSTSEHRIANAEIVISLGRGALEAMASGRAAYVFGPVGGDGWVTKDSYDALEREGFSGQALDKAIGFDDLVDDLSGWNEEMGEVGRDLACTHHDVQVHVVELIQLIESLADRPAPSPTASGELARLVRMEWDRTRQLRGAAAEAAAHREATARLQEQMAGLHNEVEELQGEIARREVASQDLRAQIDQDRERDRELRSLVGSLNIQFNALRAANGLALDESARLRSLVVAMEASRTMRWTSSLRSRYSTMRKRFLRRTP